MGERRWWWTLPVYLVLSLTFLVALRTFGWTTPPKPSEGKRLAKTKYLTLPSNPCNGTKPPLWLGIVSSAPNNSFNREQIRRTWGHGRSVVFLLGAVSQQLQPQIQEEADRYGDIVQGSFIDSYRNMTYKHVMGLQWASTYCPRVSYLLKTDDDVLVNTKLFEEHLHSLPHMGLILCPLMEKTRVQRSYRSKWRVTHDEYSDRWYPPYCSGWVILYTPDVALALSKEALKEPYFWIDDVHITGTIAKKLNITHTPLGNLGVNEESTEDILYGSPRSDFIFSLTKARHLQALWDIVNNISSTTIQNL